MLTRPYLDARELLKKHAQRPKKSWGQNFLVSARVFSDIVTAAELGPEDTVIEIGAGLGTLTDRLATGAKRVIAVERDRDMVEILRDELADRPNVEIAEDNALTFDYRAYGRVVVVGNLPYQISSPLLFRLLEMRSAIVRMVVMLQREVGARILAQPGSEDYGTLSVLVPMLADVRRVCKVPGGAFLPPPKVESVVVALTPRPAPRQEVVSLPFFSSVVHAAFGQRRKTLRNALRQLGQGQGKDEPIAAALSAAGIDAGRRGETLSLAEFAALTNALHAAGIIAPDEEKHA